MADSKGASKGREKAKNASIAGALAHFRSHKFSTEGFKSNEPIPSLSAARKMASNNAKAIADQKPTHPHGVIGTDIS